MKLVIFLLCSIGATSAFLIKANEEYVFTYSGAILTGVPHLENTFSGVAIDASVIAQADTNANPFSNTYTIALKDVKIVNFNEKLSGLKSNDWRDMETPATAPVTEVYKAFLESPVEIELEDGEVKRVILSSEEPEWSVNFKKALIAVIKMKLPAQEVRLNSISRNQDAIPDSWSVMEQGIDGVCRNYYQVTEVADYLVWEKEYHLVNPELCQGQKMFQILRTRDLTQCTTNSLFITGRQHHNCLVGDCSGTTSKVTQTRFIGCGENKQTLNVRVVISEGELQQNLLAFNTEKAVSGTRQVLILQEAKTTKTALPAIAAPRTIEDVVYEYPKEATPEERMQMTNFKKQQDFYRNKAQDPSHLVITPLTKLMPMDQQMKTNIVEKYSEIARFLGEVENFGDKKVPNHLKALQDVLAYRKVEELNSIYAELKDKHIERSLFLETVVMAGSSPCIMFAKELIMSNELTVMEIAEVMITLPHYIKTPTNKLIEEIFEILKSPVVTSNPNLKANAHLAFATIVRTACFPDNKPTTVFPKMLFRGVCDPKDPKITEQYIPHLVAALRTSSQYEIQGNLLALGAIGHPAVIPLLIPYIEGKIPGADTVVIRRFAIYSLSPVANRHRDILLPIFSNLVQDQAQERDVRIAAFACMLNMEPSVVHWQRIAISTWYEKDDKLARFVFSTLKSLSQLEVTEVPASSRLVQLQAHAKNVFPLVKPFPGVISSTFDTFLAGVLKDLGAGYLVHEAHIINHHNVDHYFKIELFLKNLQTTVFEYAVDVGGLRDIAVESINEIISEYKPKVHEGLRKMIENLEIARNEESPMWSSVYMRANDDMLVTLQAPQVSLQYVKQMMKEILAKKASMMEEAKKKVCGKTPFHLVKAQQTLPFMAMVPSDIGFPVMIETEMTSVHSMKGELDVDCSAPGIPALSLKMSHKYASTWSGYVGTVSPFTMELLAAGVSSNRAVNIPVRMEMSIEPATGTVKIHVKHVDEVTPKTTNVDIHHLHIIPVTTKKPLVHVDLTPIAADTANTKVLQSVSPKKRFETRMGERLGLEVKLQVESECDVLDRKTVMDTLSKFNYNPIALMLLMDTETAQKADGSQTLRYHKYSLIHNPRDSTTKEIKAEIKVSGARKNGNGQIIHHIASQSDKKTKQEEKMAMLIHELDTEEAMAANVLMEVALIGGSPKTYDVSLTAAHGFSDLKNKWNLHLESEKDARKFCMTGLLQLPLRTDSSNTFKFDNFVGFGSSCEEYAILMKTVTVTSQRLREQRSNLESAKECEALVRKVSEMEEHVKTLPENSKKILLEKELGHLKVKSLEKCEERNTQANSLDHVEMDITTTPNLPAPVYTVAKYLDAGMKAYLLEYMPNLPTPSQTHEPQVKIVFDFNQRLNSLSTKVISPIDVTQYKNIRLPVWMRTILPVTAYKAPMEQLYTRMTGLPLYSKCSILQGQINTFDKMTYRYNLDDCNHLVTSDCSKSNNAVLAKEKDNVKHITLFHENTKIVLSESLSRYQSPRTPYVILVDGERKEIRPNEVLVFMSKDGMYKYSTVWSKSVIIVDTPAHRVLYNGKDLIVEDKHLVTSPTCGLCGDNNEDKRGDLKSAGQCVHRSIQSMAQTYRIQDSECVDNISLRDESILQEEKSLCAPSNLIQPQISSPKHLKTLHPVMKHLFIYHQDSICISKQMVPQCPHQLMAVQDRKQTLEFVCVHAITPQAKAWVQDAQDYKEIPELASMEKEFESTVSVAVSCGMNI